MSLTNWFHSVRERVRGLARRPRRRDTHRPPRAALRLEALEDRTVPTASLDWAFAIGGQTAGQVWGHAVATDSAGNVVMAGELSSLSGIDFDPGPGVFTLTSHGTSSDGFVAKYAADGTFLWAYATDIGNVDALAIDAAGNVYVGKGGGTDGSYTDLSNIIKLDANGNELWRLSIFSGTGVKEIALDSSGNIYVTGTYASDIFVAKINAGGAVQWQHQIVAAGSQTDWSIAANGAGNVYVTGYFEGKVDFDPGPAKKILNGGIQGSNYVLKLDTYGNYLWAKKDLPGSGSRIVVDVAGNVILDGGATAKLTPDGAVIWSKNITVSDGLTVDAAGNIYLTGRFSGTVDFDPGAGVYNLTTATQAAFVVKLTSAGNFDWAVMADPVPGAPGDDIAVDSDGNVYSTGLISTGGNVSITADFDPGPGTYNITITRNSGYLWKLKQP